MVQLYQLKKFVISNYIMFLHVIIGTYQLMQFFNLKLSYMRYQVILFSTCRYMVDLGSVLFYTAIELGVMAHLYQLNYFFNVNLTF